MQALNYLSIIPSSLMPSPKTVKGSILTVSTTLSVVCIAAGILSKNTPLSAASLLVGSTCLIAWSDFGSSEELRAYKESIQKEKKEEEKEGKIIDGIGLTTTQIKQKIADLETDLGKMQEENSKLKEDLQGSAQLIQEIQEKEKKTLLHIGILRQSVEKNEGAITKLQSSNDRLREAIQTAQETEQKAQKTIESLISALSEVDQENSSLKGRIQTLERFTGRKT